MAELNCLATLAQFRNRQTLAASDVGDDERILEKLRAATADIEFYCGRRLMPRLATEKFDYVSPVRLDMRGLEFLELMTLTNGDGVTTIPSTDYILLGGSNGPYYSVEVDPARNYLSFVTTKRRCISLAGVWGWHDAYGSAWPDTLQTVQDNPLSSSATTLNVSCYGLVDSRGLRPSISAGALLKIESEFLQVAAASFQETLGLSGAPSDGDTFTITLGGQTGSPFVYTFKTTLTPTAGQVLIGSSAAAAAANLVLAMTAGDGSGTNYAAGTLPLPTSVVLVSSVSAYNVITLSFVTTGLGATSYALAKSGANLSVSVATPLKTLSVVRGANGTTAASHVQTTPIYVYAPPLQLTSICMRWANWLMKMEDAGDYKSVQPGVQYGQVRADSVIPAALAGLLAPYIDRRVR